MGTGCWFIYCRVPRAIKAPLWDQETIYTAGRKEARDQVLYSFLPRMRRGRASCSLCLGVQMDTSYSRVSWKQRDVSAAGVGWRWTRQQNRYPRGRGKTLCVCLFVCCFLATECRNLVPDQGLNHSPCIRSVEFQFMLEANSQSLGTKFTLEVPLNCPLNIEWYGLRCRSTQPVFFQHRSKWLFFGQIPNKLTDLNTPCIIKFCL